MEKVELLFTRTVEVVERGAVSVIVEDASDLDKAIKVAASGNFNEFLVLERDYPKKMKTTFEPLPPEEEDL